MLTRIRNKDIGFGKNKDQLKKEKKRIEKKIIKKRIRFTIKLKSLIDSTKLVGMNHLFNN